MKAFRLPGRVLAARVRAAPRSVPAPVSVRVPESVHAPAAVPVPWRITHRSDGMLEFEQCGEAPLRAVRVALAGGGLLGVTVPRTVHPGERLRVVLRGTHASGASDAADAMLVVRWLQADGVELLWPVSL